MYSEKVRQLLAELPNRGRIEGANLSGEAVNPVCGDWIRFHLTAAAGVIGEVGFEARGCPATIASAAALTVMLRGRSVERCRGLRLEELLDELGGLPAAKQHGAELALAAFEAALGKLSGQRM